jgi:hypothetical protein
MHSSPYLGFLLATLLFLAASCMPAATAIISAIWTASAVVTLFCGIPFAHRLSAPARMAAFDDRIADIPSDTGI